MDVRGAEWRKARRSGQNGGNCVEIVALWRNARRSGENGGACVEVAVWKTDEHSA
jgi:hypothetical protein